MSLADVASFAGVSIATVSRVINNSTTVAPKTASAVREALVSLNYTKQRGRNRRETPILTTNSRILFLFTHTTDARDGVPRFNELLEGASSEARTHDLHLDVRLAGSVDEVASLIRKIKPVGLLLCGQCLPGLNEILGDIPRVWVMGTRRQPDVGDDVLPDVTAIGQVAARWLINRGHRRLCYLNVDARHWTSCGYRQGFFLSAFDAGCEVVSLEQTDPSPAPRTRVPNRDLITTAVDRFLALSPRPTGLFVTDDAQAAVIQPALQRSGLHIGPEGIELVSVHDDHAYLTSLAPRPVSVDSRPALVGQRGLQQLLWRIQNPGLEGRITAAVMPSMELATTFQTNKPVIERVAGQHTFKSVADRPYETGYLKGA